MAITFRCSGAQFTHTMGGLFPCAKNLQGYWLFGDTLNGVNQAPTGTPGVIVGTPAYGSGFAQFQANSAYFDSKITPSGAFTWALISELPDSTLYCGAYATAGGSGPDSLSRATSTMNLAINGANRITLPGTYTGFRFIAGTYDGGGAHVYLSDSGALGAPAGPGVYVNANVAGETFKIAGRAGGAYQNVAAGMIFNRALLSAEVQNVFAFLKATVFKRGVTVN